MATATGSTSSALLIAAVWGRGRRNLHSDEKLVGASDPGKWVAGT